jgi:cobalamin biosynthetic protein CobC
MEAFTDHGGRLEAARRLWPDAPQPWIDLSTGINPSSYPAPRATRLARSRLPSLEDIAALETAAGSAFGLVGPDRIVATPGAEAALHLLPRLLGPQAVFISSPTYGGHRKAWTEIGARAVADESQASVAVVVSPNNPDGRITTLGELLRRADRLAARGGWLIVDEAFADADGAPSVAAAQHPRIVAIRSLGKFYGLAGVRLGFVLADSAVVARLRRAMGDWPVSADAIAAGSAAYGDHAWASATRARLRSATARLDIALRKAGFDIVGGCSLFRLTRAPDARRRFEALGARGILTRPFAYDPSWLRFGLPGRSSRVRLAAALESL